MLQGEPDAPKSETAPAPEVWNADPNRVRFTRTPESFLQRRRDEEEAKARAAEEESRRLAEAARLRAEEVARRAEEDARRLDEAKQAIARAMRGARGETDEDEAPRVRFARTPDSVFQARARQRDPQPPHMMEAEPSPSRRPPLRRQRVRAGLRAVRLHGRLFRAADLQRRAGALRRRPAPAPASAPAPVAATSRASPGACRRTPEPREDEQPRPPPKPGPRKFACASEPRAGPWPTRPPPRSLAPSPGASFRPAACGAAAGPQPAASFRSAARCRSPQRKELSIDPRRRREAASSSASTFRSRPRTTSPSTWPC